MDISKLKDQLIIDEGVKYETYLDHLSLKTCGIGHLCREDEPEYDLELGAEISEDRVTELFEQDVQSVIIDCKKIYDDWDNLPEEVKQIVANMMFNLGRPRYSKFRKHIQAVMDGNWQESANQMRDSRWHRQVTNRAERLCKRMEEVEV
jgi:lysozyme